MTKEKNTNIHEICFHIYVMIMRKSLSLYSKGLITTDEQDQELRPWFTASSLGGTVAAKRCLFHEEIKN